LAEREEEFKVKDMIMKRKIARKLEIWGDGEAV
jgi:hypothetical protein